MCFNRTTPWASLKRGIHGALLMIACAAATSGAAAPPTMRLYGDGADLANRLFAAFYTRTLNGVTYGGDVLDPYVWPLSKNLIDGAASRSAERLLREFLRTRADRAIPDPLRRAWLQRDLLSVRAHIIGAGVVSSPRRDTLAALLTQIIERLGLSDAAIAGLPDMLARGDPALPRDLLDTQSGWVVLGRTDRTPVAPTHLQAFEGTSRFLVFINVPGGRARTLAYLERLREIPARWHANPQRPLPADADSATMRGVAIPWPEPPQIPPGTRVLLLRLADLVDDRGDVRPTRLVESVQLREYGATPQHVSGIATAGQTPYQRVSEATVRRSRLFARDTAALRPFGPLDRAHGAFLTHGDDPFEVTLPSDSRVPQRELYEGSVVLRSCGSCHEAVGLPSFITYSRERFDGGVGLPPKLIPSDLATESRIQLEWLKSHRVGWYARP